MYQRDVSYGQIKFENISLPLYYIVTYEIYVIIINCMPFFIRPTNGLVVVFP